MQVYIDENKLIKYLAISTGFAVCLVRISTALSNIATGVSLLLAFFIWYNHKDSLSLSEEIRGYMKAYVIFVLLLIPSVVFSVKPIASIKDSLPGMWMRWARCVYWKRFESWG